MDRFLKKKQPYKKAGPFGGGVVTYVDPPSIPFGMYSTLQNMRGFHPGMRKRRGQSVLGVSGGGRYNPVVLYPAFNIDRDNPSGYTYRDNADTVWATARNGAGTDYDDDDENDNDMCQVDNDGGEFTIGRTHLFFNTSRIKASGLVTSARLVLTMDDVNAGDDFCVTQGTYDMIFNGDDAISASEHDAIEGWPSTPILLAGPTNTSGVLEGDQFYFDFTQDGIDYLNTKMGSIDDGENPHLIVMNYTYDFLDVAIAEDERSRIEFDIPEFSYEWDPSDLDQWPRLEITFDYGVIPLSIYQFRKNLVDEKHLFVQLPNAEISKAQADPPDGPAVASDNPTGQFDTHYDGWGPPFYAPEWDTFNGRPQPVLESDEYAEYVANIIPASWSVLNDLLLYSDATAQHRTYTGENGRITGAWKNITTTPEQGADVWEDLVDADLDPVSIIGIASTHEGLIIASPVPFHKLNIDVQIAETLAATLVVERLIGTTWTAITPSQITDGTSSGGKTLAQDGTVEWYSEDSGTPSYLYGMTGYFVKLTPNAGTWAAGWIDQVTVSSEVFEPMDNVWDGIPKDVVEVRHYIATEDAHYTFPAGSVNLSDLIHTNDKVIVGTALDSRGIYVNLGSTPNTAPTTTLAGVEYWNGTAFTSVGFSDGTNGFRNSGWIRFNTALAEKHVYENSQYSIFWWRLTFGVANFTDNVRAAFTYYPKYDIDDFGTIGLANGVWKDRAIWVFDKNPNYLYVSAVDRPNVLNGTDYALLRAGDGRTNRIKAIRKFHNELMVFQEELGPDGGTLTLFEGYSPATFGRLVLSYNVGTLSNNSVVVIDGSFGSTRADDYVQTLCFFISHFGVYLTDGRIVKRISGPIQNYFDPRFPENIRKGYENANWIAHDKNANVLRLGLVSGSSAERVNVWPVYDLDSGEWSFDDYVDDSKGPAFMLTIENNSGANAFIEVSAGNGDGGIFLCNTGLNDDGDAIEADLVMELNTDGHLMELREFVIRFLSNTVNDAVLFNVYRNGNVVTDEAETVTMEPLETGEPMKRYRFIKGVYQDSNISVRLQNTEVDVDLYLYDYIFDVDVLDKR